MGYQLYNRRRNKKENRQKENYWPAVSDVQRYKRYATTVVGFTRGQQQDTYGSYAAKLPNVNHQEERGCWHGSYAARLPSVQHQNSVLQRKDRRRLFRIHALLQEGEKERREGESKLKSHARAVDFTLPLISGTVETMLPLICQMHHMLTQEELRRAVEISEDAWRRKQDLLWKFDVHERKQEEDRRKKQTEQELKNQEQIVATSAKRGNSSELGKKEQKKKEEKQGDREGENKRTSEKSSAQQFRIDSDLDVGSVTSTNLSAPSRWLHDRSYKREETDEAQKDEREGESTLPNLLLNIGNTQNKSGSEERPQGERLLKEETGSEEQFQEEQLSRKKADSTEGNHLFHHNAERGLTAISKTRVKREQTVKADPLEGNCPLYRDIKRSLTPPPSNLSTLRSTLSPRYRSRMTENSDDHDIVVSEESLLVDSTTSQDHNSRLGSKSQPIQKQHALDPSHKSLIQDPSMRPGFRKRPMSQLETGRTRGPFRTKACSLGRIEPSRPIASE